MSIKLDKLFTKIAQEHLFVDTLETRNSDSLDFHDVAVWNIRHALAAAFNAGLEEGKSRAEKNKSETSNN